MTWLNLQEAPFLQLPASKNVQMFGLTLCFALRRDGDCCSFNGDWFLSSGVVQASVTESFESSCSTTAGGGVSSGDLLCSVHSSLSCLCSYRRSALRSSSVAAPRNLCPFSPSLCSIIRLAFSTASGRPVMNTLWSIKFASIIAPDCFCILLIVAPLVPMMRPLLP